MMENKKLDAGELKKVSGGTGQAADMTIQAAREVVEQFTGSPAGSMQELFSLLDAVNMAVGMNPSPEKLIELEHVRDAVLILINA